ncbi:MAG TPA: hypothetical protein VJ654_11310 [Noviherbaspirillum sp.]|nr:hypothetical protein [Noviherbaspirillum sp.]
MRTTDTPVHHGCASSRGWGGLIGPLGQFRTGDNTLLDEQAISFTGMSIALPDLHGLASANSRNDYP